MWSWISGGKAGTANLPVTVGDEIGQCLSGRSVFKLHNGTNKSNSEPVSVFKFENTPACTPEQKSVAKAEFKRLRVLRHPNVLKYVDGVENDNMVYIVTEPVTPLLTHIEADSLNPNAVCWGLYQIVTGLRFIHVDCKTAHRNLYTSSIFVSKSGEWKIGGVAFCEENSQLPFPSRVNQYLSKYDPPEVLRGVNTSPTTTDIWQLGVLIWEVWNGNLTSPQNIRDTSRIPGKLVQVYRALVSSNYKSRPTVDKVFDLLTENDGYFNNSFVSANIFLNELTIKEAAEKQRFFARLSQQLGEFPPEFCKYKILPALITTFQYGDVGIDVLPPLFKLGKLLSEEEYKSSIIPCVIKLFSSPDRAMRIQLLSQLDNFIQYLDSSVVDGQVFPAVCTGFTDTVPGMREHTIKAMLQLTPKLSESSIDNVLLKFLAKSQTDPEPPIRTNTTICLSKISCHFSDATRRKVLIPAFLRALKDPFAHARNAGLLSLCCTIQYYYEPDIANRILPSICPLLIDHDKMVRDQAMKTMKLFVEKIDNHYKGVSDKPTPTPTNQGQKLNEGVGGGGEEEESRAGWTTWAVSSMTTMTAKYMSNAPENKIGEITKPAVKQEPQAKPQPQKTQSKPLSVPPAAQTTDTAPDPDDGWDDGWDDIEVPSQNPIPKTKSSMKLGGMSGSKSNAMFDDDDSFVSSVLNEERNLLKEKKQAKSLAAVSKSPKSFDTATPAPWDLEKPPQNNAVKLTPWDSSNTPPSQNKDLLSSYFGGNNGDFFGEMGVGEKKEPEKKAKSEWDSFNLKTADSPTNDWDDDSFTQPSPRHTSQPAFKQSAQSAFKPTTQPASKQTSQPKSGGWDDEDGFDSWDTKPAKPAGNRDTQPGNPAQNRSKPAPKPQLTSDWGDDWGQAPAKRNPSPARFQPAARTSSPGFDEGWGESWEVKEPSRDERRRQQQERRNQRTRGGAKPKGGLQLGGRKNN